MFAPPTGSYNNGPGLSVMYVVTQHLPVCNSCDMFKKLQFRKQRIRQLSYYFLLCIVETKCVDPGIVANTSYTVSGLHPTNTAVYVCNGGTSPTAGNLVRTCQPDGTWDGVPVVCGSSSKYI